MLYDTFMEQNITLNTRCGSIRGLLWEDAAVFRGVPFAEAERFAYPTLIEKWDGELDATGTETECTQLSTYDDDRHRFYTREFRDGMEWNYAESPLTMNIITPLNAKDCPVLVFFHGGGFHTGKQSELPFGSSTEYAGRGIILVSVGYRLNVFGLYRSRNYCLYDQIAGIDWVRENISAFGGDPDRITISGQSAGAVSCMELICSRALEGKIRGAVMMSGGGFFPEFGRTWTEEESRDFWDRVERAAGCRSEEEFRIAPAETVWRAWENEHRQHGSIHLMLGGIDGKLVPGTPSEIRKNPQMLDIPVLIGVTSQDMIAPVGMHRIMMAFGLWSARQGRKPVYGYLFDRVPPGNLFKAYHSSDLWYIFGNQERCWRPFEEKDRELCREMADAVAAFVRTGNPGWEPITPSHRRVRYFGDRNIKMTTTLRVLPELLKNTLFQRGPM